MFQDLVAFKANATKELQGFKTRLHKISITCDQLEKAVDTFESYSYQFNIKIVGLPIVTEPEHAEQTASLCLCLFSSLGVKGVSISDIDTAHHVPARNPSDRLNAVVCKFARRLARDRVMEVKESWESNSRSIGIYSWHWREKCSHIWASDATSDKQSQAHVPVQVLLGKEWVCVPTKV